MTEHVETVIIGGGQAGLALSYYLTRQGRTHLVLEQGRVGETWRSGRWDSFTLNTPNWMTQLPGFPYQGDDPDGFLSREDIVAYLEQFAASFHAPLQCGVRVTANQGATATLWRQTIGRSKLAMWCSQQARIQSRSFLQPVLLCQWTSARCIRVSTVTRRCFLQVPFWWWAQASQAARSPRICTRVGGRSTCPPRAVEESLAATEARTPPGGSREQGFSTEHLISFPHPMSYSPVIPMCQAIMGGTTLTYVNLPGKG